MVTLSVGLFWYILADIAKIPGRWVIRAGEGTTLAGDDF